MRLSHALGSVPRALITCALLLFSPLAAHADLRIVSTLPDLAALASEIGGEHVTVSALASPHENPHFVDPRPSYIVQLSRADMVLLVGLELEVGWLPPLLGQSRNTAIQPGRPGYFDASQAVATLLDVPTGAITRAQGDVHPGGNPHFMLSPIAGADVVRALSARMAELDPSNAAHYAERGSALAVRLEELAQAERDRFAALPAEQRQLVSYHASLCYLVDWLGLDEVAHVEPLPGVSPSPGHIAEVLQTMRQTGSRIIVQEEFYPTNSTETLAQLAGGSVVSIAGGTDVEAGQSYVQHLSATADRLYDALSR